VGGRNGIYFGEYGEGRKRRKRIFATERNGWT
jgi:hypothetical protein